MMNSEKNSYLKIKFTELFPVLLACVWVLAMTETMAGSLGRNVFTEGTAGFLNCILERGASWYPLVHQVFSGGGNSIVLAGIFLLAVLLMAGIFRLGGKKGPGWYAAAMSFALIPLAAGQILLPDGSNIMLPVFLILGAASWITQAQNASSGTIQWKPTVLFLVLVGIFALVSQPLQELTKSQILRAGFADLKQ